MTMMGMIVRVEFVSIWSDLSYVLILVLKIFVLGCLIDLEVFFFFVYIAEKYNSMI